MPPAEVRETIDKKCKEVGYDRGVITSMSLSESKVVADLIVVEKTLPRVSALNFGSVNLLASTSNMPKMRSKDLIIEIIWPLIFCTLDITIGSGRSLAHFKKRPSFN